VKSDQQQPDANEGCRGPSLSTGELERPGYEALWLWFELFGLVDPAKSGNARHARRVAREDGCAPE